MKPFSHLYALGLILATGAPIALAADCYNTNVEVPLSRNIVNPAKVCSQFQAGGSTTYDDTRVICRYSGKRPLKYCDDAIRNILDVCHGKGFGVWGYDGEYYDCSGTTVGAPPPPCVPKKGKLDCGGLKMKVKKDFVA